jgi:hypothetical protein
MHSQKAGLPGKPDGYFKIFQGKRSDDKEIRNLIFGHTITDFDSKLEKNGGLTEQRNPPFFRDPLRKL